MAKATSIMRKHGNYSDGGLHLHLHLQYLCCQTADDVRKIAEVYRTFQFPRLNISFDRAVCRTDFDDGAAGMHASLIVLLDQDSNSRLQTFVAGIEDAIAAAGVNLTIRRRQQQPFHAMLGSVHTPRPATPPAAYRGSLYPVADALADINAQIRPGTWDTEPVIVQDATLNAPTGARFLS